MNYAKVNLCDIANGLGVRVSLFVSGCTHHCVGCFNSVAWDFEYGTLFDCDTMSVLLTAADHNYIQGLTVLGGEPFELTNQPGVLEVLKQFKHKFPTKDIWCYTGYTLESDILNLAGRVHSVHSQEMLQYIDVLVDGEFEEDKKSLMLKFRGSSNQRIIDVPTTLSQGRVCEFTI